MPVSPGPEAQGGQGAAEVCVLAGGGRAPMGRPSELGVGGTGAGLSKPLTSHAP